MRGLRALYGGGEDDVDVADHGANLPGPDMIILTGNGNSDCLQDIIPQNATMDRIDEIAVFAEVAERESFAAAARRLNRSPAAVTRAIGALEARLGVRLLNRTTRAVSLT